MSGCRKKRPSAAAAEPRPRRGKKTEKTEKGSKTKGRKRGDNSPSDEAASDPDSEMDEINKLKAETLNAINRAEAVEENMHQPVVLSQDSLFND